MDRQRVTWTTEDEILYLRDLGKTLERKAVKIRTYEQRLSKYLKAMKLRTRWVDINPVRIEAYIKQQLQM